MKKLLKLPYLLNFLTLLTFGCLLLDSIFYYGFSQKHFFINSRYVFIFYCLFSLVLFLVKKIKISFTLNKLNKILFPILLVSYLIFQYLVITNYTNFVYTHFHINYTNYFYLVLFSAFVLYLYNFKIFKKHFYFFIPIFTLFFSQYFSFINKFEIIILSIFRTFIVNYFLWLVILLFCTSIFKKKYESLLLYLSIFSIFTLLNHYKIKFLNLFFIFSDIYLIKNVPRFLPDVVGQLKITELLVFVLILLIFIKLIFILKTKITSSNPKILIRLIMFFCFGFILLFPVFYPNYYSKIISKLKIDTYVWGPIENCRYNGILFCFYDDLKNIKKLPPDNYNQPIIQKIYSETESLLSLRKDLEPIERGGFKPTIIVILSEALWDVTQLPNTKFSPDPIANIRKDIKSTLISPAIGTATANIEFELLTGFSNYFLNGDTVYSQAVRKNIPTLFTAFKEVGYQTTVIHPFYASMYNRPQVYKNFGLDEYISIEKMTNYQTTLPFISDKFFTQEILTKYHSTTQPQFIFAISMQNHFPFVKDTFGGHQIKVDSSLSPNNHNIIQTYSDGIYLSDQSYLVLKNELIKSKKPTIVILFGDHLPLYNPNFKLYQDALFDTSNQTKMRSTPISMWANYSVNLQPKSYLSPNFLGLEILKLANITPKNQFLYLQSITNTDTVLQANLTPKFTPEQLKNYELIQYDIIFGKQFSLK